MNIRDAMTSMLEIELKQPSKTEMMQFFFEFKAKTANCSKLRRIITFVVSVIIFQMENISLAEALVKGFQLAQTIEAALGAKDNDVTGVARVSSLPFTE